MSKEQLDKIESFWSWMDNFLRSEQATAEGFQCNVESFLLRIGMKPLTKRQRDRMNAKLKEQIMSERK